MCIGSAYIECLCMEGSCAESLCMNLRLVLMLSDQSSLSPCLTWDMNKAQQPQGWFDFIAEEGVVCVPIGAP
jgi:hypothetical protein